MKNLLIYYIFDAKFQLPFKYINILCYYVIPSIIFFSLAIIYLFTGDIYKQSISLGENAFIVLGVILFLKPLTQIFSDIRIFSKLLVLRKQLGILMLWFFLGHYIGTLVSLGFEELMFLLDTYKFRSYVIWGFLGGLIIFLLGITSNVYSVRLLKRNWKRLHSLVYIALLFIALHIYFINNDITPFFVIIIYGVLKFMAYRGITLSLKKYI